VHNAKPSIILKDQVKYLRIDVAQRAAKIAEWNRPRPWPLLLFVLGGGLLVWPAWRLWQRREQANARGSVRDAR
jgi:hypothetical protein